jgi:parvulin-like peptidyl-prolyl isomerase
MIRFFKKLFYAACLAAVLYLVGDVLILRGPVHRWQGSVIPRDPNAVVATVSGHPILRSQLDRATAERLWLVGKSLASQTSADRSAALDELIDHELLRLQIHADVNQVPVAALEIDERFSRFAKRFESRESLETAMRSQGIAAIKDLRDRLTAQIRQEKYIALCIAPAIQVSDAEARQWFAVNSQAISQPERIEVRHIFIPTLDRSPDAAKEKLSVALASLDSHQKDFATLAREISEDPATKDSGGKLGWMARDRLPADFAAPLFAMEPNHPQLIRTHLGWHLAEVTARKPTEPQTYEQAKPEIFAAIAVIKRRQAVADFRKDLRQSEASRIKIVHYILD